MKKTTNIYFISQYIWPDGSPVCLYIEQIAKELHLIGYNTVVVGGKGKFRESIRPKPENKLVYLNSRSYKRQNIFSIFKEYISVFNKAWKYIKENVGDQDVVIVSSAPFLSILLYYAIPRKTKKIYWLFDYFPPALKILYNLPLFVKKLFDKYWHYELFKWDAVIKISENLGYFGKNSHTFRLWPTVEFREPTKYPNKSALYAGNLSMVHDKKALIDKCAELQNDGYRIVFFADGPGAANLPNWIENFGTCKSAQKLEEILIENEIHLIAGTRYLDDYCFPSKIWNSIASKRKIIACGLKGHMIDEYNYCIQSNFYTHKDHLLSFFKLQISHHEEIIGRNNTSSVH